MDHFSCTGGGLATLFDAINAVAEAGFSSAIETSVREMTSSSSASRFCSSAFSGSACRPVWTFSSCREQRCQTFHLSPFAAIAYLHFVLLQILLKRGYLITHPGINIPLDSRTFQSPDSVRQETWYQGQDLDEHIQVKRFDFVDRNVGWHGRCCNDRGKSPI